MSEILLPVLGYVFLGAVFAGIAFAEDVDKGEYAPGSFALIAGIIVLWPLAIPFSIGTALGKRFR